MTRRRPAIPADVRVTLQGEDACDPVRIRCDRCQASVEVPQAEVSAEALVAAIAAFAGRHLDCPSKWEDLVGRT